MNSGLLVAHVDDSDALVDATIVEGHDMTAGKRKEHFDSGIFEGAGCELSAVYGHERFLVFSFFRRGELGD